VARTRLRWLDLAVRYGKIAGVLYSLSQRHLAFEGKPFTTNLIGPTITVSIDPLCTPKVSLVTVFLLHSKSTLTGS
jgi:hypothetical protein